MKFKVGDKVRRIEGCHLRMIVGDTATIEEICGNGVRLKEYKMWDGKGTHDRGNLKLVEEGRTVSKYDELKERIANVTAWDKEADDILQEMGFFKNNANEIRFFNQQITVWEDGMGSFEYFNFKSQCEKLEAFKKALMWLLDHSDIKKSIVGEEKRAEIDGKIYKVRILSEEGK